MEPEEIDSPTVRPYVVTGGRVGLTNLDLPLETLMVAAAVETVITMTPEKRAIIATAKDRYISIAEVSAQVKLPLGVIKVLVADLAEEGLIALYRSVDDSSTKGQNGSTHQPPPLSVLESVLDGISVL